jgi:hypothetical protein
MPPERSRSSGSMRSVRRGRSCLGWIWFVDAGSSRRCSQSHVIAFTSPGSQAVYFSAPTPCTDNPDYLKALPRDQGGRTNPRLLRVALKITF